MSTTFIGLDGEMSAADLERGGKLIQIGAYHPEAGPFCSDVGWKVATFDVDQAAGDPGVAFCEERALEVNGFTVERIENGPTAAEVDDDLYTWLLAAGASESNRVVLAIGWNVVAFDLPFVRAHLPRSASLISRRGIDLNGVALTMAGTVPYSGTAPNASGWKRIGKRAGRNLCEQVGVAGADHDAGYDAAMAYGSWLFYRQAMAGSAPLL